MMCPTSTSREQEGGRPSWELALAREQDGWEGGGGEWIRWEGKRNKKERD
jgi:hypothetical protein